jgi:GntR family transcriptional repressor for pyruvate dehydrogenase complex
VVAGRRARVSSYDGSVMSTILSHALSAEQLTPQQIWDVRRGVEIRSVTLACMHRTEKEAKKLPGLSQQILDHYLDLSVVTECDIAFHVTIAAATRNPLLQILISSLTSAIRNTNPIVWSVRKADKEKLEVVLWHSAIAEAIAA